MVILNIVKKEKDCHDDHIFPISLGGSNEIINHQILKSDENLKKSNNLEHFSNISKIIPLMLCERYRTSLDKNLNIKDLKNELYKKVNEDIVKRSLMSDTELYTIYKEYCKKISLRNSKYNWYTNGKDNLRLKFGKKPPKGYKKGRIL